MEKQFTVIEDHIKLLRRAYVGWNMLESGAPSIDPKCPYGNGDMRIDVAKILEWKIFKGYGGQEHLSEEQFELAGRLHEETGTVLQIVLCTGKFEAGTYVQAIEYDRCSWTKYAAGL